MDIGGLLVRTNDQCQIFEFAGASLVLDGLQSLVDEIMCLMRCLFVDDDLGFVIRRAGGRINATTYEIHGL